MKQYQEIRRTYLKIEDRVQAMLYEPMFPGEKCRIGIVLMHSGSDYIEFPPAKALAERGYRVLAANPNKQSNCIDDQICDLREAVTWLKNYPGIEKIIIIGHSGGATLATAYQVAAESGLSTFQREDMITSIGDIENLIPGDAMLIMDPNMGNAVMTLLSLDPSITDEQKPLHRDPSLDIFNPNNGYDPTGPCSYSEEFMHRYLTAQADRMNRLIAYATERSTAVDAGEGMFADDEPMIIAGASQIAFNNRLFPQMLSIFSHTREAWPLIHKDGSVTTQIVPCLREVRGAKPTVDKLKGGALVTTVKTFLKTSAVRAEKTLHYDECELTGVDWTSTYSCSVGNASMIKVPLLLLGLTGSYEYITAEHIYRMNKVCKDKSLAFVEGASHNFVVNPKSESYPGEFGDTVKSCFDYVDEWIESRFL